MIKSYMLERTKMHGKTENREKSPFYEILSVTFRYRLR